MALSHQSSANVQQFPYVRVCPCVFVSTWQNHLSWHFRLQLAQFRCQTEHSQRMRCTSCSGAHLGPISYTQYLASWLASWMSICLALEVPGKCVIEKNAFLIMHCVQRAPKLATPCQQKGRPFVYLQDAQKCISFPVHCASVQGICMRLSVCAYVCEPSAPLWLFTFRQAVAF